DFTLQLGELGLELLVAGCLHGLGEHGQVLRFRFARVLKHAVQRVIVVGGNRVVLVIVAAGAADSQSLQAAHHHVDLVVVGVLNRNEFAADGDEAKGGQRLDIPLQIKLVGGDLLHYKSIVW